MNCDFLCALTQIMMTAEREAGSLVLHASSIHSQAKSSRRDVVTEYDKLVQSLLVERLLSAVPDAGFIMEESDTQDALNGEHVFIIDPIDGTMNFVQHFRHSAISIAYASRGELLCACVYNPYADEMFSAIKGQGAFLNGSPIHADSAPLSQTLFCLGTAPYYPELTDETFRLARIAFDASLDLRRMASAELDLCAVAAGRAGLYIELGLSLWDFAAGMLIVQEAGGSCVSRDGQTAPLKLGRSEIFAGGPRALSDFLSLLGSAAT